MRLEVICTLLLALAYVDGRSKKKRPIPPFTDDSDGIYLSDEIHYWETSSSSENEDSMGTNNGEDLSLNGKLRRQFALSLFLQDPSNSAVCSPISALMPLGKLAIGASDSTRKELLPAIGLHTLAEAKSHFQKLISDLRDSRGVIVSICSGVYVDERVNLKSKFKKDAENVFGSSIERADFSNPRRAVDKINAWVSRHTNNKINNILKATDVTTTTSIILVNAVYFSGRWANAFSKARPGFFYGSNGQQNVLMMYRRQDWKYYDSRTLNAEIVAIPYMGGSASFVLVLPKSKSPSSLTLLLKQLKVTPDLLKNEMRKMDYREIALTIPKFKIETTFDLSVQYRNIGLQSIFHKGLTRMVDNQELFVSKSVQSAVIEINERGTMAASASEAITLGDSDTIYKGKVFVADHPFLFTLVVKNQQLFTGVLTGTPTGIGLLRPI